MSLYRRGGEIWWYEFSFNSQRVRESTKTSNRRAAQEIEAAARVALAKGEVGIVAPKKETRTVGDLLDGLAENYQESGKLSPQNVSIIGRTRRHFGAMPVLSVTSEIVSNHIRGQQKKGAAPATINRTLQCLNRCYTLAKLAPPEIHLLKLDNARKGFFSAEEMDRVLVHLPNDGLRDFCAFGHLTGMRSREIKSLRWDSLQSDGVLKLEAKNAKARFARTIPTDRGALADIIARRKSARTINNGDGTVSLSPFIFHRGDGRMIGDFRRSWKTACKAAGLEGRLFHDCRRSFCRDAIRSGVPEVVVMSISGHRTRSIFDRYNIASESDRSAAFVALEQYRSQQKQKVASING